MAFKWNNKYFIFFRKSLNQFGVLSMVEVLSTVPAKDTNNVMITSFQCYRQEFVKGEKSGKWIKILPVIEYGDNATQSMLIDGSGYYLNDPDNGMLYFVDFEIKKNRIKQYEQGGGVHPAPIKNKNHDSK